MVFLRLLDYGKKAFKNICILAHRVIHLSNIFVWCIKINRMSQIFLEFHINQNHRNTEGISREHLVVKLPA